MVIVLLPGDQTAFFIIIRIQVILFFRMVLLLQMAKNMEKVKALTLFINSKNEASFGTPKCKINNAISGQSWLEKDKNPVPDLNDQRTAPRTAVGLDGPGKRLIMIVVNGRQPFFRDTVTIQEMAELMIYYGGDNAINLDGGGSSTLVFQDPSTKKNLWS